MPTFFEFSIYPDAVRLPAQRRFCVRADATVCELREIILLLTGWTPAPHPWDFVFHEHENVDPRLWLDPAYVPPVKPARDPASERLSEIFDPSDEDRAYCRYFHDFDTCVWRVTVLLHDRCEILDDRRCWLVSAAHPWPPFEVEGPRQYQKLLDAWRTGHDPAGRVRHATQKLNWSSEVDVPALEARLAERFGARRAD